MKNRYLSRKNIYYLIAFVIVTIFLFNLLKIKITPPRYARDISSVTTEEDVIKEKKPDAYLLEKLGTRVEGDTATYIKDISSIMIEADVAIRNVGLEILPIKEGLKYMNTYIVQLRLLRYPEMLSRQHKMVLLSFKKIRMGFLLFSLKERDVSIRLVKNGVQLLKYAAKDIVEEAKRENLIKEKNEGM